MGRKLLGLSPEEMKLHRRELRKKREKAQREASKLLATQTLLNTAFTLFKQRRNVEDVATRIVNDPRWTIKYNPGAAVPPPEEQTEG